MYSVEICFTYHMSLENVRYIPFVLLVANAGLGPIWDVCMVREIVVFRIFLLGCFWLNRKKYALKLNHIHLISIANRCVATNSLIVPLFGVKSINKTTANAIYEINQSHNGRPYLILLSTGSVHSVFISVFGVLFSLCVFFSFLPFLLCCLFDTFIVLRCLCL